MDLGWYAACSIHLTMRTLQTISADHLHDVTGGAKRITVRPNNDEVIRAMTSLKSDIESVGKAQANKSSSSSSMMPMMMMMMMKR